MSWDFHAPVLQWTLGYMCPPGPNPLPPPTPSHSPGLSQCRGFEYPVSCIKFGLVVCFTYGNTHVSMLFSQIIPPSPFPTESKSLFFVSESLLLSHVQAYHCPLSKFRIFVLIYCISAFLSDLTSLCVVGSSFIHLIRTDSNAFFLRAE